MIKRMIKDRSTESDAKASNGVPWLTDDQGASNRKSDAKATWPTLPPACLPRSWNASVEGNGTMRA